MNIIYNRYSHVILDRFVKHNSDVFYSPTAKLGYFHGFGRRTHYTIWENNTGSIEIFPDQSGRITSPRESINHLRLDFSVIDKRFINNSRYQLLNDKGTKISKPTIPDDAVYISADGIHFYALSNGTVNLSASSDLAEDIIRDSVPVVLEIPNRSKNLKFNKYKREMIKEIKLKGSLNMFETLEINDGHPSPTIENIFTDHAYQGILYKSCLSSRYQSRGWYPWRFVSSITGTCTASKVDLIDQVATLFHKFRYTDEQQCKYIRVQS